MAPGGEPAPKKEEFGDRYPQSFRNRDGRFAHSLAVNRRSCRTRNTTDTRSRVREAAPGTRSKEGRRGEPSTACPFLFATKDENPKIKNQGKWFIEGRRRAKIEGRRRAKEGGWRSRHPGTLQLCKITPEARTNSAQSQIQR